MQSDIVVPAFEMDCLDWLVVTTSDFDRSQDIDGAPVLAKLSTAMVQNDRLHSVSGVLMLGLLDDDVPPAIEVSEGSVAAEMLDLDCDPNTLRYLLPLPGGQLALVAEFDVSGDPAGLARLRINELMGSFCWS